MVRLVDMGRWMGEWLDGETQLLISWSLQQSYKNKINY